MGVTKSFLVGVMALTSLSGCGGDGDETSNPSGPANAELRSIDVDGLSIAYLERPGTGPVVFLVHGFPDNAYSFDRLSAELNQRGFRTVAPFLPGYPPTGIPTDDVTILDLGHAVLGLVEALGVDRAILVGHDWGGTAVYAAANIDPSRVDRIVTISSPHEAAIALHPEAIGQAPHFSKFSEPGAAEELSANDFAELDGYLALWSPSWAFPSDELERVKATLSEPGACNAVMGYYRAATSSVPDPITTQKTTVPGLTIYGTHDGSFSQVPYQDQQAGFTLPVRVVPLDSGHWVHRERESEVTGEILEFLK